MKKTYLLLAILSVFVIKPSFAEETVTSTPQTEAAVVTTPAETAPAVAPEQTQAPTSTEVVAEAPVAAPIAEAASTTTATPTPEATATTTAPATSEAEISENLEFVSGEVSSVDAVAKTVTVKLYGENEDEASDKVLTVRTDDTTDVTDGDKDREIASLTAGTEVDVEFDPASNKATYIFVY